MFERVELFLEVGDKVDFRFSELECLPYFITELSEGHYFIDVQVDASTLYHVR